ncbi:PQQ-like beta-propeller repeat protein [Streptomyces diastatochromogenes]|nr:PQQ-like beta-propeller repeat protein [Streptomyces diastatochromogenes]
MVTPAVPGLHSVPTLAPVSTPTVPAGAAAGEPRKRRGGCSPPSSRSRSSPAASAPICCGPSPRRRRPREGSPARRAPRPRRGRPRARRRLGRRRAERGAAPGRLEALAGEADRPAFGCSAGEKALVCRTTDGRYEALDPADGKPLWTADLVADPRDDSSTIGPTGGIFVAGGTNVPAVHGDSVVLLSGKRLQVRDARSGAVRWEQKDPAQAKLDTRPIVGDGTVFVRSGEESDQVAAYALADGRRLWSASLTNAELSRGAFRDFEPVAYANGLVYALSDGGLVALDAKTGRQRGQVPTEAKDCGTLGVQGRYAYCAQFDATTTAPLALYRLDATTLAPVGDGRLRWPPTSRGRAPGPPPCPPGRPSSSTGARCPGRLGQHGRARRRVRPRPRHRQDPRPLPDPPAHRRRREEAVRLRPADRRGHPGLRRLLGPAPGAARPERRPGKERVVPVPGAPGPRAKDPYARGTAPTSAGRSARRRCCRSAVSPTSCTTPESSPPSPCPR